MVYPIFRHTHLQTQLFVEAPRGCNRWDTSLAVPPRTSQRGSWTRCSDATWTTWANRRHPKWDGWSHVKSCEVMILGISWRYDENRMKISWDILGMRIWWDVMRIYWYTVILGYDEMYNQPYVWSLGVFERVVYQKRQNVILFPGKHYVKSQWIWGVDSPQFP